MHRTAFAVMALFCSLHLSAATKKPQLPAQYKKWLDQDVVYIITDEERKAFLALTTDDEREKFMENFWDVRNPLHGSDRNPYKEEHYARIEYANAHFGHESNTPGWMTDMGRAYILFGPPTSRHPFVGYSQIYPMELWFYENNTSSPALPSFFYLLFYIDGDIGEYKFYRPFLDGPMKLVRGSPVQHQRGRLQVSAAPGRRRGACHHVAGAERAHRHGELISPTCPATCWSPGSRISPTIPFNVSKLREMRSLHAKVDSYFLVNQERPVEITSLVLADPAGKYWLDYGVLIDDPKAGPARWLAVEAQHRLPAYHRVRRNQSSKTSEERAYTAFDDTPAGEKKFAPFLVADRLPIEPGTYKLAVEVTNRQAQQTYKGEADVAVGPSKQASFSGPLVTTSVDRVARPNPFQPFEYFGVQFHPAARHEINHPDPLRLLFELHEPAGATANYQMEYIVAQSLDKDGRRTSTEEIPQSEFKDGRLLKSKTIAVNDLENGDYRLIVNLREAGSSEVVGVGQHAAANLGGQERPSALLSLGYSGLGTAGRGGLHARSGGHLAKERFRRCGLFPPGPGSKPRQHVRRPVSGAALLQRAKIRADRGPIQASRNRRLQNLAGDTGPDRTQLPPERRRRAGAQRHYGRPGDIPGQRYALRPAKSRPVTAGFCK